MSRSCERPIDTAAVSKFESACLRVGGELSAMRQAVAKALRKHIDDDTRLALALRPRKMRHRHNPHPKISNTPRLKINNDIPRVKIDHIYGKMFVRQQINQR